MSENLIILKAVFSRVPFAAAFVCMIHDAVVSASKVEGESMQPTLNPNPRSTFSDYVLLYRLREPYTKGDVVVFRSPRDPSQLMIKRIIAWKGIGFVRCLVVAVTNMSTCRRVMFGLKETRIAPLIPVILVLFQQP